MTEQDKEILDLRRELAKQDAKIAQLTGENEALKVMLDVEEKKKEERRAKNREKHRKWREANPERSREIYRNWCRNHKEQVNALHKKWRDNNKDKVAGYARNRRAKAKAMRLQMHPEQG